MNNRKELVNELRDRLLPTFIDKGFKLYPLEGEEKKSREMRSSLPFGYLKRFNGNTLQIIEIQLDVKGDRKFVINCGKTNKELVITPFGLEIYQENFDISCMKHAYCLYDSIFFKTWFGNKIFKKNENTERLVQRAIIYSQEIHNWFEQDIIGKHMKETYSFG